VLAVVGQITPWKGQIDALRALAEIRSRWPSLRLLIVGAPKFVERATRYDNRAYLRELHALVVRERLEPQVRFLGERADIPEVLAACDVVLAPSWEEPFGRSIVEAMAMGVPIASTDVGGVREILPSSYRDRLANRDRPLELANAVNELLSDREAAQELAAEGLRWVRRFDASAVARQLAALARQ
jgi:glycosyltransferase involved in cell wall biosynthesis